MKRFHLSSSILAALILLLLALFSRNDKVEGRQMPTAYKDLASTKAVRDLQINKEMKEELLRGEKDSYRVIPRTGSSPIQNKIDPLTDVRGSWKQHITSTEP